VTPLKRIMFPVAGSSAITARDRQVVGRAGQKARQLPGEVGSARHRELSWKKVKGSSKIFLSTHMRCVRLSFGSIGDPCRSAVLLTSRF
jgi:hypothetical protein